VHPPLGSRVFFVVLLVALFSDRSPTCRTVLCPAGPIACGSTDALTSVGAAAAAGSALAAEQLCMSKLSDTAEKSPPRR
jgi:hypothetical protein